MKNRDLKLFSVLIYSSYGSSDNLDKGTISIKAVMEEMTYQKYKYSTY